MIGTESLERAREWTRGGPRRAARGDSMKLKCAFELSRGEVVAFIGAGGKTSLLVSMGYELAEAGWRVLATATTNLTEEQLAFFPCALRADADAAAISQALNEKQFVLLYHELRGGRVYGPPPEWARQLLDRVDSDILLVEADDANGLPFKAPRAGEPRIPAETSLVVAVASLGALGAPLDADHVYNHRAMIEKYGFVENSPVKSPWLAQILRDEELGLQGVPKDARLLVYLNQTPERGYVRGRARLIARLSLQNERISAVALGSVRGAEPVYELQRRVGALVLAAADGGSVSPSAILQPGERGRASLANVTEKLYRSRIDHVRVITGRGAGAARRAIQHLGVEIAHNRAWKTGGIRRCPAHWIAVSTAAGGGRHDRSRRPGAATAQVDLSAADASRPRRWRLPDSTLSGPLGLSGIDRKALLGGHLEFAPLL